MFLVFHGWIILSALTMSLICFLILQVIYSCSAQELIKGLFDQSNSVYLHLKAEDQTFDGFN